MFHASRITNNTKARKVLNTSRSSVLAIVGRNNSSVSSVSYRTQGVHTARNDPRDHHRASSNSAKSVNDVTGVAVVDPSPTSINKQARRNAVVEGFFADSQTFSKDLHNEIHIRASELSDFLISTRRNLHKCPELMYQEKETSAMIQAVLKDLDIPYTTGWAVNTNAHRIPGPGGFGVVADIGTGKAPCVLLRADIDALPIHEQTNSVEEFKSQNANRMHACGHDGHATMLLGAASILKGMEDSIHGTVRLMFQPAEEGGAGSKRMVEEGLLNLKPQPQNAFGMHVWPTLPSGSIAGRPGPILAAAERFEIVIAGKGGHAAMPHLTHDPIVTASAIIMNLQTVVSRMMSPLESGVVSITKFHSGDAFNVIPDSATLRGTIRALSTDTLIQLRDRVHQMITSTAELYGCNVTLTYSPDFYPVTVNDPELYEDFSKDVAALVSNEGYVRDTEPTMGAEDFSFLAEKVPSTFFLLGQGSGQDPPTNYGLHHPRFALDESVMPKGVELHVNLALRALQRLNEQGQQQQQDPVSAVV